MNFFDDMVKGYVSLILANETKELLSLEQKCKNHPIKECRNGVALRGGEIRNGETPFQALAREMVEELPYHGFEPIITNAKQVGVYNVNSSKVYLFESLLETYLLLAINQMPIIEEKGKPKAVLSTRRELTLCKFIYGQDKMLEDYFRK